MKKIGLLHSIIRGDEKLLIQAANKYGVEIILIDVVKQTFCPDFYQPGLKVVLERCVSAVQGLYATKFFESLGLKMINSYAVASTCVDKFMTSLVLQQTRIPTLAFALVFNQEQAFEAVHKLGGFPVVIKPTVGSWGRLLAKANDKDALEAIIEHKDILGSPQQKAIYIQQYVKKPERDIRAFVIGGKTVAAIYRNSPHWITNTARGGKVEKCFVTNELKKLCQDTSEAIGGGILALDILETKECLKVIEVNHTMEFKNSEQPTGVSISGEIINYCLEAGYAKS